MLSPDQELNNAPAIHEYNRRHYELFWQESRLVDSQRWPQWEIVQKHLGQTNLELGPGPYPRLPVAGNYFLDISQAAVSRLQKAGGHAFLSDLAQPLSFPDEYFDLICAFEILEHLPNDAFVLKEIRRCLKPHGALLLSFPLGHQYWTAYDAAIGHARRYEVKELDVLFGQAGLKIEAYALLPFPYVGSFTGRLLAHAVQKYPRPCLKVAAFLYTLPWSRWLKRIKLRPWEEESQRQMAKARSGLFLLRQSPYLRLPAVAGRFYPADPGELGQALTRLLQAALITAPPPPPQILIVPHAGITYSGRAAAAGFRQIEGRNYAKIILLGASHHQYFTHAAVYAIDHWTTPLGQVVVHPELAQALLDEEKGITPDPTPHVPEHALEVELIFLQKVLKDFQIVPILVSQPSEKLIEALAQKIAQNFDAQTLLVVSTDLSHYPSWEVANRVDAQTIAAILSGQKKRLEETVAALENEGSPNLDTAACGFQALRVALRVAEIIQIKKWQKLKYENSGDITGDQTRVVGYAAIVGYGGALPTSRFPSLTSRIQPPTSHFQPLNPSAQQEALTLARRTLESYLATGQIPSYSPQNAVLRQPSGVFTTLRKNGQLRGCLGEFKPQKPLYQVIQSTAVAAATQDRRFPPLAAAELPEVKMEISVLTPPKKADHWQNIKLGTHGVVVQKGGRVGAFLPQVAKETGWNLEQFLRQLCSQKAGLPPDCHQDPTVNLYTFEAQVFGEE